MSKASNNKNLSNSILDTILNNGTGKEAELKIADLIKNQKKEPQNDKPASNSKSFPTPKAPVKSIGTPIQNAPKPKSLPTPKVPIIQVQQQQKVPNSNPTPNNKNKKKKKKNALYGDKETITNRFMGTLHELLSSLAKGFPECSGTREKLILIEGLVDLPEAQTKVAEAWNKTMGPFYKKISAGKIKEILDMEDSKLPEVFIELKFREKYKRLNSKDFDQNNMSTRDKIVKKIVDLNKVASVFAMPESLRNHVEGLIVKGLNVNGVQALKSLGEEAIKSIGSSGEIEKLLGSLGPLIDGMNIKEEMPNYFGDNSLNEPLEELLDYLQDPEMQMTLAQALKSNVGGSSQKSENSKDQEKAKSGSFLDEF